MRTMLLILLPLLAGYVSGQEDFTCACGLFYTGQDINGAAVPLEWIGREEINPEMCDREEDAPNQCRNRCLNMYANLGDGKDVCSNSSDTTLQRCYGSIWCESLHNQGFSNLDNAEILLYYRIPECPPGGDPDYSVWQIVTDEGEDIGSADPLCCIEGIFEHCTVPCPCVMTNLCECGFFAKDQFEIIPNGTNAIPLEQIGYVFSAPDDEGFCDDWPAPEFDHPCDILCTDSGIQFVTDMKLDDIRDASAGKTYGEAYCDALYSRWNQDWPENGIEASSLVALARMPGCPGEDGNNDHLKWFTDREYATHSQELCCDGEGKWDWCLA